MPSALFEIDPGTGSYGSSGVAQNAAVAVTVNCRITSLVGVDSIEWRIFGTHGVTAPTITLSGAPNGQIASFTLGSAASNPNGQAYGIELKVNGGTSRFNPQGDTKTSAVFVLNDLGLRPAFIGETLESDAAYGIVPRFNDMLGGRGDWPSTAVSSTPYTVVAGDRVLLVSTSGSAKTINLPAAASNAERVLVVKDVDGNAAVNNITLDGNGAETIDGAATHAMASNYGWRILYCNGTAWFIISAP